jgi:hypothetical protein
MILPDLGYPVLAFWIFFTLSFQSFDVDHAWLKLFQTHVVLAGFGI